VTITIGERRLGDGAPPWIVAEVGVNHDGDTDLALELVARAAEAGADAVKFQTFATDALTLPDAPQAAYQRERAPADDQAAMLRGLELPESALRACAESATSQGMVFLSTPFDLGSLALLADMDVPAVKIGSGDLTNAILLRAAAALGRPLILSTGASSMAEVAEAVELVRAHGNPPLMLLHCVSSYPAVPADLNLRAMASMAARFAVPVGWSDHSRGWVAAVAATALGAALIEKHLTTDRARPGPDHAASLEPDEFADMVGAIRDAHAALGDGNKEPRPSEEDVRRVARRSLVLNSPVLAGTVLTEADLDARRPALGISPMRLVEVVGRRAVRDLEAGTLLEADDLDPPLP
jgi:N-acetylneuraminate synthase/N,N'-diacetyllegionaminate synthase